VKILWHDDTGMSLYGVVRLAEPGDHGSLPA